MSYIRCLSNPEALYVWSDGKHANILHHVKEPNSSGRNFTIPAKAFERVLKLWAQGHEPAKCAGAVAEEIHVDRKTGALIPDMKPCKRGCQRHGRNAWAPCKRCFAKQRIAAKDGEFFVRLSYKGNFVNLWRVTFDYMTKRFRK